MAKAIALCACKKCGKEFEKVAFKYNRRDANNWEEWAVKNFTLCPECEQIEHQLDSVEAAKEARDNGLPQLIGTPKQIIWAEQIRKADIKRIQEVLDQLNKTIHERPDMDGIEMCVEDRRRAGIAFDYICKHDQASYWIDNRYKRPIQILQEAYSELCEKEEIAKREMPKDVEKEITVIPHNQTKGTANIVIEASAVLAKYPKDDDFRVICKKCGYRWNADDRCWKIKITSTSGTAVDRAAELTNALLTAGFAVCCGNAEVRERGLRADFEPICDRWIMLSTAGAYKGWLYIRYPSGNDELYKAARAIKGAKYSQGIYVPVSMHALVQDFANLYDFKFTAAATEAIKNYEMKHTEAVYVSAPKKHDRRDKLAEILSSSDDIIPDLSDD